ncbi:hypothetical protein RJ55_05432 [Drechmeria coniospora]|nr:hypothetical protein RJ55_05432 [Drechmeria coniospora]
MPENLAPLSLSALDPDDQQDAFRTLARTPHPYHHQREELPHPSERILLHIDTLVPENGRELLPPRSRRLQSRDSTPASESGTEADDEHFLRRLPAPRARLHKGLRGRSEPSERSSGSSTPLPSSATLGTDREQAVLKGLGGKKRARRPFIELLRREKVLVRRATEVALILALGCMVHANQLASPLIRLWSSDLLFLALLCGTLLALYPVRVVASTYRLRQPSRWIPLRLSSHFDPAPLLYPPTMTLFVSLLVSANNPAAILPNIVLSVCSIPQALVPKLDFNAPFDTLHWRHSPMAQETMILLYPLHHTLCAVLHRLTTTSLLTTELQLLSIALVNVLILAASPQLQILRALLWVGGLGVLLFCAPVIRWNIALARIPKWRFQRATVSTTWRLWKELRQAVAWGTPPFEFLSSRNYDDVIDGSSDEDGHPLGFRNPFKRRVVDRNAEFPEMPVASPLSPKSEAHKGSLTRMPRRHTLSHTDRPPRNRSTHTPSGRRKRAMSTSSRPFIKLTQEQATIRKWMYALYVYVAMLAIIFLGVRLNIQNYALGGDEPIGWGLGYAFGDIGWFRFHTIYADLERWILLPRRADASDGRECRMGWVQHLRHDYFGEANTRLILAAYWVLILILGLTVVFRLKETYEVDTRRKVFHFMMVGMLLPATYVDPTYLALVLSLVLAIFLILDLLRASQLPPLSKPIATFLAPYVDGRDFRGPVVISHIFLLIGCAIPLWLALAALPRTGTGHLAGWEVPTRDVSMVSGVVCVGLGDAAASLIGRRYGRRKWLWGGGKSLEGSAAFAVATFAGLVAAAAWLRVGGWPMAGEAASFMASVRNAAVCGSMASLTEAVLTGGNDNVIVPVVLWTCVKSLGM